MALLLEGAKLALQPKVDQAKSVVFVKLTDSALRGLEEYLRHRVSGDTWHLGPAENSSDSIQPLPIWDTVYINLPKEVGTLHIRGKVQTCSSLIIRVSTELLQMI